MILQWLISALVWLAKLVIPASYWPSTEPPHVDPNAACPSCGNCNGRIVTKKLPNSELVIQHDCNICKAVWHEKTIVRARNIIHTPPPAATK